MFDFYTSVILVFPKHFLKFLWKSEHYPWRYKTKREWVFFSEHCLVLGVVVLEIVRLRRAEAAE